MSNYVVAIGFSAGGLKPMLSFFDCTPHDNTAYVILCHLPCDYQSMLERVIERHSKLKIVEAVNYTRIEKDTVYILPCGMHMTIKKNRLYLQKREEKALYPNWAVDVFLSSLAKAKGEKSIAVILSGSGSDGSKGAALIKQSGGMVIVQSPESCQQNSMPLQTMKACEVDYILLPSNMPKAILQRVSSF